MAGYRVVQDGMPEQAGTENGAESTPSWALRVWRDARAELRAQVRDWRDRGWIVEDWNPQGGWAQLFDPGTGRDLILVIEVVD